MGGVLQPPGIVSNRNQIRFLLWCLYLAHNEETPLCSFVRVNKLKHHGLKKPYLFLVQKESRLFLFYNCFQIWSRWCPYWKCSNCFFLIKGKIRSFCSVSRKSCDLERWSITCITKGAVEERQMNLQVKYCSYFPSHS